jgi:phosphoenolpyruvate carboxylase
VSSNEDVEHTVARVKAALEQSREIGWLDASTAAAHYLRSMSVGQSDVLRTAILLLAVDICEGKHRVKP